MRESGWTCHSVLGLGTHTHGLPALCGRPDLEITLPIHPRHAADVLAGIVEAFRRGPSAGGPLPLGVPVTGYIAGGLPVVFAPAIQGDRSVLRVILPDPCGRLDRAAMDPAYASQWDGTLPARAPLLGRIEPGQEYGWLRAN